MNTERVKTDERHSLHERIPFSSIAERYKRRRGDSEKNETQQHDQLTNESEQEIYFVTIGFYGNESAEFSEKLEKTCQKYSPFSQVNIAFKKTLTLKGIFLLMQKGIDKIKNEKKVAYKVSCKDCN